MFLGHVKMAAWAFVFETLEIYKEDLFFLKYTNE